MTLLDHRSDSFSLAALAAVVAAFSARLRALPADERVAASADERTLRYYQSLGVLDRPSRYEGRQAIYGYRHLLQALAVKALQAHGHSLAQVQRALLGATDAELESAVLDALGEATPGAEAPAAPAPAVLLVQDAPAPQGGLRAYQIGPGLILTVDCALHPDPDAIAARVKSAVAPPSNPYSPRGTRP